MEITTEGNPIATYYYSSNDGLSYEESSSNTYIFNNLEKGTEYNFKVYAVDTNGINSNINTLSESTLTIMYLADYIKNTVYTGNDGDNGLYYHDGEDSYGSLEAGDNSYRYSGADPNNYVCFASDAATCPNDNLYRIIGVFGNQVKLIKHDYANRTMLGTNGDYYGTTTSLGNYYKGSQSTLYRYYWNSRGTNTWSDSQLNTVNLNANYINYLNGINSKWNEMIETTNWQEGGIYIKIYIIKQ